MLKYLKEYQRFKLEELNPNYIFLKEYKSQLKTLLEEKILIIESLDIYYFKFVGAVNFLGQIIIIFPKYKNISEFTSKIEKEKKIKLLFQIFEKYQSTSLRKDSLINKELYKENNFFNLFSLYNELILDYIKYGLYYNYKNISELNGIDEINWQKTITEISPFFSLNKEPIYINYYTRDIQEDNQDYIKLIQQELLSKASLYLKQFKNLGINIMDFEYNGNNNIYGEIEYKISKINIELREVFTERKIYVLKLMRKILEELNRGKISNLYLYGTKNYEQIWEDICQNVFGHEKKWLKMITKPRWKDSKTKKIIEVSTLIPDITVLKKDVFYILDAKYYSCEFDLKGNLKGTKPGVRDISKQLLYQEAYENYFSFFKEDLNYFNAFLIPSENIKQHYEIIGEIDFPLNIFKTKTIKVIKLNTVILYDYYINNQTITF
ncbi:LlaJI restriction endonuclease [Cetobacterium ceti]|uniref:LlaJI restriction endonuclease n=1 Tax=Cetobacterium ceti TaxID=180163 RepID=A0A1T4QMQ2_9FUSO|nr:LlaJI family restriction endonuclease [Cetobacterium ceti]SKA04741.1 LlaJI restriction endonuclease [Cetobacterium ceti]